MKSGETLSFDAREAAILFACQGEFVGRLNLYVDSVEFNSIPPQIQQMMLSEKVEYEEVYFKLAEYLSKMGCGDTTLQIYDFDTRKNVTPRGGI